MWWQLPRKSWARSNPSRIIKDSCMSIYDAKEGARPLLTHEK